MTDGFATAPGAGNRSGERALAPRRRRSMVLLLARGPGPVSFDHIIRLLARG